ncbi:hypothetical protein Bca101_067484 [Brassica carinata]
MEWPKELQTLGHNTQSAKLELLEPMISLTFMVIGWKSEHQLWRTRTLRSSQDFST